MLRDTERFPISISRWIQDCDCNFECLDSNSWNTLPPPKRQRAGNPVVIYVLLTLLLILVDI